jgi:sulfur transfer ThiS family protein
MTMMASASEQSTIAVRVTFTGEMQTLVGRRELRLDLPEGATVTDLLAFLSRNHGEDFASCVFSGPDKLRQGLLIFVDGENIKGRGGLGAALGNSEVEVLLLTMLEGG